VHGVGRSSRLSGDETPVRSNSILLARFRNRSAARRPFLEEAYFGTWPFGCSRTSACPARDWQRRVDLGRSRVSEIGHNQP
jgi:hypothetical protein